MNNPAAVLISDIHYNIHTLPLADAAMRQAIAKANELQIPLIVAGDLHDTKANLRGECVSAMRSTLRLYNVENNWNTEDRLKPFVIVGNHDLINERSKYNSLSAIEDLVTLIDTPTFTNEFSHNAMSPWFLPYFSDPNECRKVLSAVDKGSLIIMHQGLQGSDSGEYIQDKSAISKEDVADFRVISGHYHARQDIKTGRPRKGAVGLWSYVGNPYTLGFGEANHPEKGFQILMDDGTLEFVPTNLREHVVLDYTVEQVKGEGIFLGEVNDLVWVKVSGSKEELSKLTKKQVAYDLDITQDFRLDLIPTDEVSTYHKETQSMSHGEILDDIIDSKDFSNTKKVELKDLWKSL